MNSAEIGKLVEERQAKQAEYDELREWLRTAGTAIREYGQRLEDGTAIGQVGGEPDARYFDLNELTSRRKRARELRERIDSLNAQLRKYGA